MSLKITQGDITKMQVDAIVNAANEQLLAGGGVCGAIFHAAGYAKLTSACQEIGFCPTGQAIATKGYQLSAPYIIHTVGPIYQNGKYGEEALLYSAYQSSLTLAKELQLNSIAFPLISSGIYGYPKEAALYVAVESIQDFLSHHDLMVYLVLFDTDTFQLAQHIIQSKRT